LTAATMGIFTLANVMLYTIKSLKESSEKATVLEEFVQKLSQEKEKKHFGGRQIQE